MSQFSDGQKLTIGYVLGSTIYVTCLGLAISDSEPRLAVLLCLLGGAMGWTVGIVATPYNSEEKSKFSSLWKGFAALGSGYVIGKLESFIVNSLGEAISRNGKATLLFLSLFLSCFLVGLLFTLISRIYGESESTRKQRQIARALSRIEKIETELQELQAQEHSRSS